jgi:hypothetical protein
MSKDRFKKYPYAIIERGKDYGKRGKLIRRKPVGGLTYANECRLEMEDGTIMFYPRGAIKSDPKGLIQPRELWDMEKVVGFIIEQSTGEGSHRVPLEKILRKHTTDDKQIREAFQLARKKGLKTVSSKRNATGGTFYRYDT